MNKVNYEINWIFQRKFLKKAIIGVFITFILVYFATIPYFVKPLYESEAIVYVPLTIISQQLNQHGVGFAGEKEIDWYIQLLKSDQLADSIITKFKLYNYTNVDSLVSNNKSKMYHQLSTRIKLEKTRYGSVSIRVRDTNPDRASEMVNEIVILGEKIKEKLLYPNRLASVKFARTFFEQKAEEVDQLEQKLDSLEKSVTFQKKNELLYEKFLRTYQLELQELISRKNRYEREKNEFYTPLPVVYVVSKAIPSSKTVFPKRLNLAIAAMGIYFILLVIIEIIRNDSINKT